jgi:hypothetical protein
MEMVKHPWILPPIIPILTTRVWVQREFDLHPTSDKGSSMDIDTSQDMDITMNTAVSGRPSIYKGTIFGCTK